MRTILLLVFVFFAVRLLMSFITGSSRKARRPATGRPGAGRPKKPEGTLTIEKKPTGKKSRKNATVKDGEYIDYEEIK